jgi:hypothetical protein
LHNGVINNTTSTINKKTTNTKIILSKKDYILSLVKNFADFIKKNKPNWYTQNKVIRLSTIRDEFAKFTKLTISDHDKTYTPVIKRSFGDGKSHRISTEKGTQIGILLKPLKDI